MIFPGALGDLVCFLPALTRIAADDPAVVLQCREDLVDLVRGLEPRAHDDGGPSWSGNAIPIESPASAWLFSEDPPAEAGEWYGSFDSVVSYTGWGSAVVERNLRRWNGEVHPFRPFRPVHQAVHFLDTVGVSAESPPELRVRWNGSFRERELRPLKKRPALVVHPGSGGAHKRWSRDAFTRLVALAREHGWNPVIVLGPAERDEASAWETSGTVVVPDDVAGLAATLASADAYVGNDSGPTHLAAALGLPGIALFGPTEPGLWRPLSERFRVLRPTPWAAADDPSPSDQIPLVSQELRKLLSFVSA